jgi:hypothetical protein
VLRRLAAITAIVIAVLAAPSARAQQVIINGLDDIDLGTWPGFGSMVATMDHCLGIGNGTSDRGRLTITGSGAGGAFALSGGVGTTPLPFTVDYNPRSAGWRAVTAGVALTNLRGTRATNCLAGAQGSQLRVTIAESDITAARAATYSGVLTLVVAPE